VSGPHRAPFRFIDRVLSRDGTRCVALKLASVGEALQDRSGRATPASPGESASVAAPAYPAALVLEALAQAAVPLADEERAIGPRASRAGASRARHDAATATGVIVGIRDARVLGSVRVGDRLRITAEITARFAGMIRVRSRAEVDGRAVAEGEFTIAVDGPA
jgi:3-hydroxymyristoyl/3-hydroxydecanoyl-(acyl carrier protein) dehydratase